jgi:hypothetical protein
MTRGCWSPCRLSSSACRSLICAALRLRWMRHLLPIDLLLLGQPRLDTTESCPSACSAGRETTTAFNAEMASRNSRLFCELAAKIGRLALRVRRERHVGRRARSSRPRSSRGTGTQTPPRTSFRCRRRSGVHSGGSLIDDRQRRVGEAPRHPHHRLDARRLVADRHRQALTRHQRRHQLRRLRRLLRLRRQEREHPRLGHPPAVHPRQHAQEVRLQRPQPLERARRVALEVVGRKQLHVGRRVLAEAQQVLVPVALLEEARHQLATERLHVRPHAVTHRDQHVRA